MIIPFRSKFKFKIHVLNLRSNRFFSPPRSTPPPARSIPSGATSSRSPSPPSIPPVLIHALSSLRSPYVYAGLPTLLVLSPLFSSVLRTSPSALLFSILRFALLAFLTVSPPHDPERTTPPARHSPSSRLFSPGPRAPAPPSLTPSSSSSSPSSVPPHPTPPLSYPHRSTRSSPPTRSRPSSPLSPSPTSTAPTSSPTESRPPLAPSRTLSSYPPPPL